MTPLRIQLVLLTPFLLLPMRPEQLDINLKDFLNAIFLDGLPIDAESMKKIVRDTDEYTLMSALKFIWCRLPGNCIIGWKVYTKFVKMEEESNYPRRSFLEFMPLCLASGAHASIVYDFFDLIVAIAMNSKENMTAKKISKVCGLWAFHPVRNKQTGTPSFERGLFEWIPAGDAMFHLLLAFLNSMPPKGQIDKLPKVLQLILKRNPDYPPPPTEATPNTSAKFLQEIPMVTIRANRPSKNPAELITRVSKTLKFDDPALFYTREDYLLLKRLFNDPDLVFSKLSEEGARILDNLCLYDEDMIADGISDGNQLRFRLLGGWAHDMTERQA
ncbi:unnamed protein product [Ambrosiozyma monospora]|uniref:Unnamed protein product n=1 Tax=Ambrosiozyma monospora TaxID=43982 RepID=A0ACB5TC37_AMBMO|nr:unnamed protein product [Ambrosiozyma monospora]